MREWPNLVYASTKALFFCVLLLLLLLLLLLFLLLLLLRCWPSFLRDGQAGGPELSQGRTNAEVGSRCYHVWCNG